MPEHVDLTHNKYLIRRKVLTILGAKFQVFDEGGSQILFSKQKAFKLREDIRVYRDETLQDERLLIRARQIIDFSAAYDVIDSPTQAKIGTLRRKGFRSILRDSWEFLDVNDQPIASLQEDSMGLAMVRRVLLNLVPQRFHVSVGERRLVNYRQYFNPFIYKLEVTLEPEASEVIDPRLALGAGILLAAVEGRQD